MQTVVRVLASVLIVGLALTGLTGCGPSQAALDAVDYTPVDRDDWAISTPQEQGLDANLVAELYHNAGKLKTVYSVLVVKNGFLVAEQYFNEGSIDQQDNMQSVTKSYFSTLVGLALAQGCLDSIDQKMVVFFPDHVPNISDPRKMSITIEQLLQMRSGYPYEETNPDWWSVFLEGDWPPLIEDYPLVSAPGAAFNYSNLSSYLLGVIVQQACETDLRAFAEENLFAPTGTTLGEMWQDDYGYYYPTIHVTARDAARYGQLYLDDGMYQGAEVVPADWVAQSLTRYSSVESHPGAQVGPNYLATGYGYQWWEVTSGAHTYDTARGHGGQTIALLPDQEMVIVVTADPFFLVHNDRAWRYEKANFNLVGDFIASLPAE